MRRKQGVSMKSHTIRMTDEEWAEMQRCAEIADESDSEYIRKAVRERNQSYNGSEDRHRDFIHNKAKEIMGIRSANQTEPKEHMTGVEAKNNTVAKTPPMVNTFMKGEKK